MLVGRGWTYASRTVITTRRPIASYITFYILLYSYGTPANKLEGYEQEREITGEENH